MLKDKYIKEEEDFFLSIVEGMKIQQGSVYFKSDGIVSHVNRDVDTVLTGNIFEKENEKGKIVCRNGTNFVEDDVNREINIAQLIQDNVQYDIGTNAIGAPWILTILISLVILDYQKKLSVLILEVMPQMMLVQLWL